jgi:hypothetical protein
MMERVAISTAGRSTVDTADGRSMRVIGDGRAGAGDVAWSMGGFVFSPGQPGSRPPIMWTKGGFLFVYSSGEAELLNEKLEHAKSYALTSPGDGFEPFLNAHDGNSQFVLWVSADSWEETGGWAKLTVDGVVKKTFMLNLYDAWEWDAYAKNGHLYWVIYRRAGTYLLSFTYYTDDTDTKTIDLSTQYQEAKDYCKDEVTRLTETLESSASVETVTKYTNTSGEWYETEGEWLNYPTLPAVRADPDPPTSEHSISKYYVGTRVPMDGRSATPGYASVYAVLLWEGKVVIRPSAEIKVLSSVTYESIPEMTPNGPSGATASSGVFVVGSPGNLMMSAILVLGESGIMVARTDVDGPNPPDTNWTRYFASTEGNLWLLPTQEQPSWDGPKLYDPDVPWAEIGYEGTMLTAMQKSAVTFASVDQHTNPIPELTGEIAIAGALKLKQIISMVSLYPYEIVTLDDSGLLLELPYSFSLPLCVGADGKRVFLCNQYGSTILICDRETKSTVEASLLGSNMTNRIFRWDKAIKGASEI